MAVHVTENERRRLGLAPKENLLLTSRSSRAFGLALALFAFAVGAGLLLAGRHVGGGVALGLGLLLFAQRLHTTRRYYLTQTRLLVRQGGRETWHELVDVAGAVRQRGVWRDRVVVSFRDGREPLLIPNLYNGHVVAAHIREVAARAHAKTVGAPAAPVERAPVGTRVAEC